MSQNVEYVDETMLLRREKNLLADVGPALGHLPTLHVAKDTRLDSLPSSLGQVLKRSCALRRFDQRGTPDSLPLI